MDISQRTREALSAHGLSIDEAVGMSEEELLQINGVGPAAVAQVRAASPRLVALKEGGAETPSSASTVEDAVEPPERPIVSGLMTLPLMDINASEVPCSPSGAIVGDKMRRGIPKNCLSGYNHVIRVRETATGLVSKCDHCGCERAGGRK